MKESEEPDQAPFSFPTLLSNECYKMQESLFKKNISKSLCIYQHNILLDKLHLSVLEEEKEFTEVLNMLEKNQEKFIEIPKYCNANLMQRIIHYFYFHEVKPLPLNNDTYDFLDLAILFNIQYLIEHLCTYLKQNITNVNKAVSIRLSLFPIMRRSNLEISDSLKEIIADCENLLLQQNNIEDYLSFYYHQYFSLTWDSEIEHDLFNRLKLMKKVKIEGIHFLKLVSLFKDRIILLKKNKKKRFNFKVYVEKIIHKYIKLVEINEKDLNKIFERLGLDVEDFKLNIAKEKIADLEERESKNKEKINMLQNQMTSMQKM